MDSNDDIFIHGDFMSITGGGVNTHIKLEARYLNAGSIADFEFFASTATSGTIKTYEMSNT